MRCDFADSLLHGYFDGELDTSRAAEFELHLNHCADCSAELVTLDILSDRLQIARLYESAPASLRRKLREDIVEAARTTDVSQPRLWHWLAACAALFLIALVGWRVGPQLRSNDYPAEFAEEIVEAHQHSLQPGRITKITSNDPQAVKTWFEDKLKFELPVRDFANDGFALRGGRVDLVYGRTIAALVYAHNGHLINLFIWPTGEQDTSPRPGSRQGFQWVDWKKRKLEFCAVTDATVIDFERLQLLLAE